MKKRIKKERSAVSGPGQKMERGLLPELDPRSRLLVSFAFTLVIATAQTLPLPVVGLGLGLLAWLASGLGARVWLKRSVVVNTFVAFLWLTLPWRIVPSQDGLDFVFARAGIDLAWLITLKVNAIFMVTMSLLSTCQVHELGHGMARLGAPEKLVALFLLFFRYVYLIQEELSRLSQAMRIRCFKPGTNFHTYSSYASLLGMLLVRGFDRGTRVHQAMLCRGWQGRYNCLDYLAWQKKDTFFVSFSLAGLAVVWLLDWSWVSWSL
ncbi:cobalt ECF transporter T component CbiQ [Dethiosulfatarculus sandiegensis]|uniref:Cobalt ABC transporter permease n=1 Tax=Dethiosulfatarculus sandiegensis TaxID=1429043 RepID=A0A0D2HT32_9BACT|nr:cobalt ECF transporter T component CbiQ [Dethiosulfatarculus sandiegensis]KIX13708.1 cobalt ABC transporter permease [Dethiosulfatarculus sandiegensis]